MLRVNRPEPVPHIIYTVGTGGVKKGQLVIASSGTAVTAAEAPTDATVLGVALDTKAEGAQVQIECIDGSLIEADIYQGGSTDSFTATDVGKAFDIFVDGSTGEMFVDPNDTTGAFLVLMSYDTSKNKAWLKIHRAKLLLV